MTQRDDRFDIILQQFVKQVVVELKSFFIGFFLIPVREDPRPGDGCAEAPEPHLSEQPDVFLISCIEIDRLVIRIIVPRQDPICDLPVFSVSPCSHHIRNGQALTAFVVSSFELVGSHRTAPQKIMWNLSSLHTPPDLLLRFVPAKVCGTYIRQNRSLPGIETRFFPHERSCTIQILSHRVFFSIDFHDFEICLHKYHLLHKKNRCAATPVFCHFYILPFCSPKPSLHPGCQNFQYIDCRNLRYFSLTAGPTVHIRHIAGKIYIRHFSSRTVFCVRYADNKGPR